VQIKVIPVSTDLSYDAFFSEPRFPLLMTEGQLEWLNYFRKDFMLALNDIKINREALSNNLFHFSKMYGKTFLDVSYGLEQVHAAINNPSNTEHILSLYGALTASFKDASVSIQRFSIQEQLSSEGEDAASYLKTLNQSIPQSFETHLKANMVGYTLNYPEEALTITIVVAPSIFIPGGLYLHRQFEFTPSPYDYQQTLAAVQEKLILIQKVLEITYKGEEL